MCVCVCACAFSCFVVPSSILSNDMCLAFFPLVPIERADRKIAEPKEVPIQRADRKIAEPKEVPIQRAEFRLF